MAGGSVSSAAFTALEGCCNAAEDSGTPEAGDSCVGVCVSSGAAGTLTAVVMVTVVSLVSQVVTYAALVMVGTVMSMWWW